MGRTRFLVSVATVILTLSLVAVGARAITLPDTSSACSTGSSDGCLKITNTDNVDYGSPAIVANTQSQFGTGIVVSAPYTGLDASSSNIGVNASGTNMGVTGYGSWGIYGQGDRGVYGTTTNAAGYGVYGENDAGTGVGM